MPAVDLGQLLAAAFAHIDAGRFPEAGRLARQLDKLRPDLPGLAYLHGLLLLKAGDGRKAAQSLSRALAQTPDAPPLLAALARAQLLQKRYPVAGRLYRRLLTLLPASTEAWQGLADLAAAAGDKAALARLLSRAARLRPDDAVLLTRLGQACREAGQADRAALAFARAIDADPASLAAHLQLAALLRRLQRPAESLALADAAVTLAGEDAAAWLELGMARRDLGQAADAAEAFAVARRFQPDGLEALWLQAESLAAAGAAEAAAGCYRDLLAADPADRFGAGLALAQLAGGSLPERASPAFVRGLFDQYAGSFDHDLVDGLHYRGPAVLADAIARALGAGPFAIFDAGCGTGLAGAALKPRARRLDGADLSGKMLARARARGLYDDLAEGDLVAVLRSRAGRYDLVMAADVLIYLGDLEPVFAAVAAALTPGGGFAFTVEKDAAPEGFSLGAARRYRHSRAYLERLAAASGFTPRLLEEEPVRHDQGRPVPGLVAVLTKG